jgi:hypothetical protein
MQSTFLGRPLVQLPPSHPHVLEVKFKAQERVLYGAVEKKFRALINKHLAKDDPLRNLTLFVVQLNRLRQSVHSLCLVQCFAYCIRLTSHPILIEHVTKVCTA